MAALHASTSSSVSVPSLPTSSRASHRSGRTVAARASVRVPRLSVRRSSADPIARRLVEELTSRNAAAYTASEPLRIDIAGDMVPLIDERNQALERMYMLLQAVSDRYEMHRNVGEQRDNWNALLLNSVNMMTLTATATAALSGAVAGGGAGAIAVKVASAILFSAATGMMLITSKIQPSQLAEEQRNASRLFKQLEREITTLIATKSPIMDDDVRQVTKRVLALDKAYPLPLLGVMIEKFPKRLSPAIWWPNKKDKRITDSYIGYASPKSRECNKNGWSGELESEMRSVLRVMKQKDKKDYLRLGGIALKLNKALAVSGPLLTAAAAAASLLGVPSVAAAAGAMAAAVNTMEHGGQVGMVVEMYRNCAGFFELLERTIEEALEEEQPERRENGEVFERKVAMRLGRSLSEMRELVRKERAMRMEGLEVDEFASKLF